MKLRAELAVAVRARAPDVLQKTDQLGVARAGTERRAQVRALRREQARIKLPVRGQPCAMAVAAERIRDRRDEADLALPVDEAIALRDLAAIVLVERLKRPARADLLDELLRRHDLVAAPAVQRADVHVFDEPDDDAGAAETLDEIEDAALVLAALHHRVDLDRREARGPGGVDRLEDRRDVA